MGHYEAGGEVLADREPSEHGLSHDPQRQQRRQHREITPERPAGEREHHRDDGQNPDQSRDGAVPELDQRVGGQRREVPAEALGPIGAAQPRAGQPDRRAGQHDQRQGHERRVRHATELRLINPQSGTDRTSGHETENVTESSDLPLIGERQ
jgi:hypothetical protein